MSDHETFEYQSIELADLGLSHTDRVLLKKEIWNLRWSSKECHAHGFFKNVRQFWHKHHKAILAAAAIAAVAAIVAVVIGAAAGAAAAAGGAALQPNEKDKDDKDILMLAYANQEAVEKTVKTGLAHYYSTSRKKLWLKGETSGHRLVVKEISADCDADAVLVKVESLGPGVCHEGYVSCFFRRLEGGEWKVSEERAYDPDSVYGGKA